MTLRRAEKQIHGDIPDLAPYFEKRQWKQPTYKMHEIKIARGSFILVLDKLFHEATRHIQDRLGFFVNRH